MLIAVGLFCYNLYSKLRKKNNFNIIIDNIQENISSSNKVGLEYKIKFLIYLLISIYSLCYAILSNFEEDASFESLKIIN